MGNHDFKAHVSESPWTAREDWARGMIRGETGAELALLWIMSVLWNGFIWTVLLLLWGDQEKVAMVKVATLFAAIGLFLLAAALYRTLVWLRFGSSVLELAAVPGVIGGTLDGRIRTRCAARLEAPVQLSLSCLRRQVTELHLRGSGRIRHQIRTDVLWQGRRLVPPDQLERDSRGVTIPVSLHIPYGLESSDVSNPSDQIIWKLSAASELPGADFSAEFAVPVFTTDASDPELSEEKVDALAEMDGAFAQPVDRKNCWVPPVAVQPTSRGGIKYTFRLAVTLKAAVGVTALALAVCAGSVALFIWLGEAGPFALIPGALGALLLLATAVIWTFVSRVVVEEGSISIRKSVLGVPRFWRIRAADVAAVKVKREGEDWVITIERRSDPEVDLGATIPGRNDATAIADDIKRLLS